MKFNPEEILKASQEARQAATYEIRALRTGGMPIAHIAAKCGVSTMIIRSVACEPAQMVHTGEMACRILINLEANKGRDVAPPAEDSDCKPKISDVQLRPHG